MRPAPVVKKRTPEARMGAKRKRKQPEVVPKDQQKVTDCMAAL